MARLGEAYVRVRADLKDFDADLDKALKRSTDKFEKTLNRAAGQRIGRGFGAGLGAGIDTELAQTARTFVSQFERSSTQAGQSGGRNARKAFESGFTGIGGAFGALGGLLTDGFSAIPPQLKTAIGAGFAAAIIPAGAAITAALATGIAAGVAGLGIALSFQFEEVEAASKTLFASIRTTAVQSAEAFVGPVIASFSRIDEFFTNLAPRLESIFGNASEFVEPLTTGFLSFVDQVTIGLDTLVANSDGLIDALSEGMIAFGKAVRISLEILADLGPQGEQALKDLILTISILIVGTAGLLRIMVQIYDAFRQAATSTTALGIAMKVLIPPLALAGVYFGIIDKEGLKAGKAIDDLDGVTEKYIVTETGFIKLTKEQTKALEDQTKQFKAVSDAELGALNSTLDYQESLLDLTETLKENGKTTATNTRKGIENVRALEAAFVASQDRIIAQYKRGEISQLQAIELYRQQTEDIYRLANAGGIASTEVDRLFREYNELFTLPPLSEKLFGGFIEAAQTAITYINELANRIANMPRLGEAATNPSRRESGTGPGQQRYADGGIVNTAQLAWIGEGGKPEVVLPLTNPRRTRELAAQSGLMNILGGDGASTVIVYIGNEQLDSRMFRVANASSRSQARMMTQSPRMI